jgi:hypothetical protein
MHLWQETVPEQSDRVGTVYNSYLGRCKHQRKRTESWHKVQLTFVVNWVFNRDKIVLSINGRGPTQYSYAKEGRWTPSFIPYKNLTKSNSEWAIDLNLKNINSDESLWPLVRQKFLGYDTKSISNKRKLDWTVPKFKTLVLQTTEWEKLIYRMGKHCWKYVSDIKTKKRFVFKTWHGGTYL